MSAGGERRGFGWREIIAALIVLAVYSSCLQRMPTHTFWSPDEGCKYIQSTMIHWDGGIHYELPYGGQAIDPDADFYAGHIWGRSVTALYPLQRPDGSFGFHWPMWFPFLVKAPVELFGATGGFIVAMLAGWLAAILSGVLAREIDRSLTAPAILIVGLSTPIWFYSLCFWEHTTSVALALLAVLILVRGHGDLKALLLALPVAAAAAMLRIEMLGLAAALCATVVVVALRDRSAPKSAAAASPARWSRPLMALAAVAIVVALLAAINMTVTGRHIEMLWGLPLRMKRLLYLHRVLTAMTVSPYWRGDLVPLDWRWGIGAVLACLVAPWARRRWLEAVLTIAGLGVFALYTAELAMAKQYYRTLYALLPIAPFMLLAGHGIRHTLRRQEPNVFVLAVAGVAYFILGIAGMAMNYFDNAGNMGSLGLAWGQRYLLTLYPLLCVLGLAGLLGFWRSAHRLPTRLVVVALALAMIAIGVKFELRGYEESRSTRATLAQWQTAMERGGPLITDIWWLPASVATYAVKAPVFAVGWPSKVGDWIQQAAGSGVSSFTFASLSRVDPRDFGNPPPRKVKRRSGRVVRGLHLTKFSFLSGASRPRTSDAR